MSAGRLTFLLLILLLAPACAPQDPPPPPPQHLVLLTDATQWDAAALQALQDSLTASGYRVLTSGFAGETAAALTSRLPWLLQPGVDLLLYDDRLAGPGAFDTLQQRLEMLSPTTELSRLR